MSPFDRAVITRRVFARALEAHCVGLGIGGQKAVAVHLNLDVYTVRRAIAQQPMAVARVAAVLGYQLAPGCETTYRRVRPDGVPNPLEA